MIKGEKKEEKRKKEEPARTERGHKICATALSPKACIWGVRIEENRRIRERLKKERRKNG